MLYHLKEKSENFIMKMEGARCIDSRFNVHYFLPVDNSLEIEEMLPCESEFLLKQFKLMGYYDVVFVDMSSAFGLSNIKILEVCDEILLVLLEDNISISRAKIFAGELDMLSKGKNLLLEDKMNIILNRYEADTSSGTQDVRFFDKAVLIKIPLCIEPLCFDGQEQFLGPGPEFEAAIERLLYKLAFGSE